MQKLFFKDSKINLKYHVQVLITNQNHNLINSLEPLSNALHSVQIQNFCHREEKNS